MTLLAPSAAYNPFEPGDLLVSQFTDDGWKLKYMVYTRRYFEFAQKFGFTRDSCVPSISQGEYVFVLETVPGEFGNVSSRPMIAGLMQSSNKIGIFYATDSLFKKVVPTW